MGDFHEWFLEEEAVIGSEDIGAAVEVFTAKGDEVEGWIVAAE
jgi:hypothetical protein